MLCHLVLPYSNCQRTTACRSESLSAIKRGVQEAVLHLGKAPEYHQTDNSTAATHILLVGNWLLILITKSLLSFRNGARYYCSRSDVPESYKGLVFNNNGVCAIRKRQVSACNVSYLA